ncbi:MAG TPA: acyltransferase [Acidimicrobiales bacterium]|nr:acyltransferase [Acidimicrobiales bacterium]
MGTATDERARRDTSLDVLRTVAALGVVATHARWLAHVPSGRTSSFWDALHASAWGGTRTTVYLFFALSGFLIARPFVTALLDGRPLPQWRGYARRRVARIVPAYWLAFTAFLVFGFATGATALNVADHYLLVHNEVPGDAGNLLPVAWTLGIEASFYLAVPLVAVLVRRRHRRPIGQGRMLAWVGGLTAASVALHLAVFTRPLPTGWGSVEQYTLPAQFLFFAPGVALAVAEHGRRRPLLSPAAVALGGAAAAAGWVGCMYLFVVSHVRAGVSSLGFAVLSGLVLCLARWSREPASPLGRAMAWVGTVSYGLYLWHWLVMRAMYGWWGAAFKGTGTISWPLSTAIVLALSLPLAAASWQFVERPLMGWAGGRADHRTARRRAAHPAGARPAVPPPGARGAPAPGAAWPVPLATDAVALVPGPPTAVVPPPAARSSSEGSFRGF